VAASSMGPLMRSHRCSPRVAVICIIAGIQGALARRPHTLSREYRRLASENVYSGQSQNSSASLVEALSERSLSQMGTAHGSLFAEPIAQVASGLASLDSAARSPETWTKRVATFFRGALASLRGSIPRNDGQPLDDDGPQPQPVTPTALTWQAAVAESGVYKSWRQNILNLPGGIDHSEPLLKLVRPLPASDLQIAPGCADLQAQWVPSNFASERGKVSTAGQYIAQTINGIMSEMDCVWWLTNGSPFQLARGSNMTDPDWDVAYMCRTDSSLPYYECERGRHGCTGAQFSGTAAKLKKRVEAAFPDNQLEDFENGHLTVTASKAMPSPAGKIIDFAPNFVMAGSTHVHSGAGTTCSEEYGGAGWPCARWNISTIFPLKRCLVAGVVVPCPADVATYSQLDNQAEYVDEGHSHCHGCNECLLWGDGHPATKTSVLKTIAAMKKLEQCGFANMLSLVPTLVEQDSSTYCGCGIVKGRGCQANHLPAVVCCCCVLLLCVAAVAVKCCVLPLRAVKR